MAKTPNRAAWTQAVGYTRVSTRKQARGGISLEQQAAAIPTYCTQHGLTLLQVHQDAGISGKRAANRPGLQAALEQVQHVCGTLVVPSVSRFGRNALEVLTMTERLDRAGCRVAFMKEGVDTATPAGRFMLQVLASFAELEREGDRERVQDAMDFCRESGFKLGGRTPYGFRAVPGGTRKDGRPRWKLEQDPAEQDVLQRVLALRAAGHGYHAIQQTLAADGVRGRTGRPLNIKVIWDLVQRHQPKLEVAR